jgi:hypothetical protein
MLNAVHCFRCNGNSGVHVRAPFVELFCDDGRKSSCAGCFWNIIFRGVELQWMLGFLLFLDLDGRLLPRLRAFLGKLVTEYSLAQHSRPLSQTLSPARSFRLSSRSPARSLDSYSAPRALARVARLLCPQVHDIQFAFCGTTFHLGRRS